MPLTNKPKAKLVPAAAASKSNITKKSTLASVKDDKNRASRASFGTAPEDDERADALGDDAFDDQWLQPKTLLKPEDQLDLTEEQLKEDFTRILSANNPHAAQNIVRFSHKEQSYKLAPAVDQTAIHFELEGYMLHKGSDEAKRQLAANGVAAVGLQEVAVEGGAPADDDAADADGEGAHAGGGDVLASSGQRKEHVLRNQFNFSERACQTFNNPQRDRATSTEPPPRANFSATVNQWEIHDAYAEDQQRQAQLKDKKAAAVPKGPGMKEDEKKKKLTQVETQTEDVVHSGAMVRSAKIIERMVNQNTFDDISQDFKYWEDQSDEFRDSEGTLLPLWKFVYDKAKRKAVTSLCWNPQYHDFFAVGYGSYDFSKQGPGMICAFTLKNPSYPEYVFNTESGVMCLDFNRQHPSLLAVGLYDGSVAIYNVQEKTTKPMYQSTAKTGKHTDPVWQVCWQEDDIDKNLNFYSVSSDGRVTSWTLVKNELHHNDVIELRLEHGSSKDGAEEGAEGVETVAAAPSRVDAGVSTTEKGLAEDAGIFGLGCGTCFDFNRANDHLFIVGTEEGKIRKCSKDYSSQYLDSYNAHQMSVYSVKWNHFHSRVFISCSADWTVKVWDHTHATPILSFDLNNAVGDAAWAPYSSTVFAAATSDGKLHIYDLNENKHEPLCEQQVVRKAKLTHIAFNPHFPILIVGDDRGGVTALKLSPNLRKALKEPRVSPDDEFAKMEKLLNAHATEKPVDPAAAAAAAEAQRQQLESQKANEDADK
eukprot:Opistho-2@29840